MFLKFFIISSDGKKKFPQYTLIEHDTYYKAISPGKRESELSLSEQNLQYYIYNYHNVKKSISLDKEIYFVEGEKDANTLISLGFVATTVSETTNFNKTYISEQLRDAKIRVICDNNKHGEHMLSELFNSVKDAFKEFKVVLLIFINMDCIPRVIYNIVNLKFYGAGARVVV